MPLEGVIKDPHSSPDFVNNNMVFRVTSCYNLFGMTLGKPHFPGSHHVLKACIRSVRMSRVFWNDSHFDILIWCPAKCQVCTTALGFKNTAIVIMP